MNIKELNTQFITNEKGEKVFVVIPFSQFSELIEDIEDLRAVIERKDEPTISHEELLKELKEEKLV